SLYLSVSFSLNLLRPLPRLGNLLSQLCVELVDRGLQLGLAVRPRLGQFGFHVSDIAFQRRYFSRSLIGFEMLPRRTVDRAAQRFHSRVDWSHQLSMQIGHQGELGGGKGGRDFIHKIQVDIRHVQVANGADARTDNRSDPHTGWPPQQPDEGAEPQSPDRADGKFVVALLCRYR